MLKYLHRLIRVHIIRLLSFYHKKQIDIQANHILVVAPHPDDEVFGCAGIIQNFLKKGIEVSVIILTRGENSSDEDNDSIKRVRTQLAEKATTFLGVKNLYWGDLPDGSLASVDMFHLKDLVSRIKPDAVFVPHYLEGWSDHEVTEYKWKELLKTLDFTVKYYHYCVWFWFSMPYYKFKLVKWRNTFCVKMSKEEHQRKLQAIDIYLSAVSAVTGKPYSGSLPDVFLYANKWNRELFFETQ